MKRRNKIDRQLKALDLLWERGSATLRDLHGAFGNETTLPAVRHVVHDLEEEGYVRAELEEGDQRYHPAVTRRELGRQAARRILNRIFRGSVPDFLRAVSEMRRQQEETADPKWR